MTARQVITIRVDQVEPDPTQPRKSFPEESLRGLAETMRARQVQPIVLCRRDGRRIILDGERRWRAAKIAGMDTIDAIIVDGPMDGTECRRWQLIANSQREDLPLLEKAEAIHLLMEETKWTVSEAAQRLGESPANLSKLLTLRDGPQDVQDAVKAGLGISAAYELARVADATQRRALIDAAAKNRLSRDALSRKIKRIRREAKPDAIPARALTRATAPLGEGRSVTITGRGLSIETLVEWLELLIAKARKAKTGGLTLETFIRTLRDQAS